MFLLAILIELQNIKMRSSIAVKIPVYNFTEPTGSYICLITKMIIVSNNYCTVIISFSIIWLWQLFSPTKKLINIFWNTFWEVHPAISHLCSSCHLFNLLLSLSFYPLILRSNTTFSTKFSLTRINQKASCLSLS